MEINFLIQASGMSDFTSQNTEFLTRQIFH